MPLMIDWSLRTSIAPEEGGHRAKQSGGTPTHWHDGSALRPVVARFRATTQFRRRNSLARLAYPNRPCVGGVYETTDALNQPTFQTVAHRFFRGLRGVSALVIVDP